MKQHLMAFVLLWAAASIQAQTVELCTDYTFKNCGTSFTPSDKIFLRATFPKPVGEFFKEAIGMDYVPMSGKAIVAIGKDENDENPIVIVEYPFFPNRYESDKQLAFTLQMDEKMVETLNNPTPELQKEIPFNSLDLMAKDWLKNAWVQQAASFPTGKNDWQIFVFLQKDDNVIEVGSRKFSYVIGDRSAIANNMNDYDKQRFEKTPDDGMTNATHSKYVDKVVFANGAISASSPSESSFKSSFASFSEGIYARCYLRQSCRNFLAEMGNGKDVGEMSIAIRYSKDGKVLAVGTEEITAEQALKTTSFKVIIAPKSGDSEHRRLSDNAVDAFTRAVRDLSSGTHKIKTEIVIGFGDKEQVIASGEFSLTLSTSTRDAFVKAYEIKTANSFVIYLNNTGGSKQMEMYYNNSKVTGYPLGSGSTQVRVEAGYVIKINGSTFRTISSADSGKTFTLP